MPTSLTTALENVQRLNEEIKQQNNQLRFRSSFADNDRSKQSESATSTYKNRGALHGQKTPEPGSVENSQNQTMEDATSNRDGSYATFDASNQK